jgi:hypothetical protein
MESIANVRRSVPRVVRSAASLAQIPEVGMGSACRTTRHDSSLHTSILESSYRTEIPGQMMAGVGGKFPAWIFRRVGTTHMHAPSVSGLLVLAGLALRGNCSGEVHSVDE